MFLHIPKTGGLSLRQTLLRHCAPGASFRIIHQIDDAARFARLPLERRRAIRLIEGHMYYGIHQHVPSPCVYITILRDPVARIRSYYNYVCRSKWHFLHSRITGDNLTLRDCIEQRITVELDNYMTRSLSSLEYVNVPFGQVDERMYVAARAHLESIAIVGTTDRMGLLYRTLASMICIPLESPPHINRSDGPCFPDRDGTDKAICEFNTYDRMLYDDAVRLAQSRAGTMGIEDQEPAAL
ncbi:MAG: sulfotransferase family 2 domain-containing protein [Phycisphaeraceae bacterium]|nr:sulfotransferase family 2 domain-containing protein [Phycisphaeraceae bacterium]MBX3367071.1 sulfotransferase family 2 domain-containing protein [Phycisphaeraceae bacterium]